MLYILLPAYNEEEGLEFLLNRIERIMKAFSIDYKIIIVDDGSQDHTALVIESYSNHMPIELIRFDKNMGITKVFAIGFKKVCSEASNTDICITMDSDNTQNPYVLLDMLKALNNNDRPDIVIASRFEKGGAMVGVPFIRKCLSVGVSYILRRLIPINGVKDYSTFYRAYRVRTIKQGFEKYGDDLIKGHGFSAMAGLLIKLNTVADKICEVPCVLRYDFKEGRTGMNIAKTILGYLSIIIDYFRFKR